MGASVQFIGKSAILKAFDKIKNPRWSLWMGSKDMITCYSGNDLEDSRSELEDWLDMMRNNTTAQYTIRFYGDKVKEIKPGTPHDTAINVRMATEEMVQQQMGAVPYGLEKALEKFTEEVSKINKRIDELESEEDDEPPLAGWEKALENPVVMGAIGKFLGIDMSKLPAQPAKMSGVPGEQPVDDIDASLDILEKADPNFAARLAKLARLITKNPKQYNVLATMLDSMAI